MGFKAKFIIENKSEELHEAKVGVYSSGSRNWNVSFVSQEACT